MNWRLLGIFSNNVSHFLVLSESVIVMGDYHADNAMVNKSTPSEVFQLTVFWTQVGLVKFSQLHECTYDNAGRELAGRRIQPRSKFQPIALLGQSLSGS